MREAAERRQQLELEHEQALAVLNAKQQEIDLLQKVKRLPCTTMAAQEQTHVLTEPCIPAEGSKGNLYSKCLLEYCQMSLNSVSKKLFEFSLYQSIHPLSIIIGSLEFIP